MKQMRIFFTLVYALLPGVMLNAQSASALLSGVVTENANIELSIVKTVNGKNELVAEYTVGETHPEFAFVIQSGKNAGYNLRITLMKMGHVRLEKDKSFDFPLKLDSGKNYSLKITPSKLNVQQKTGVEVKQQTAKSSVSIISGVFTNAPFGVGSISVHRVENGTMVPFVSANIPKSNMQFSLAVPVKEEGFYYVTSPRFRCRVYLKPSDLLDLKIDVMSGVFSVVNGSNENRLMEQWQTLSHPITKYGYFRTLVQADTSGMEKYLDAYIQLQPAIAQFKASIPAANAAFKKQMIQAIDVDNGYAPLNLQGWMSAKKLGRFASAKNIIDPPAYFKQFISPQKFNDAGILKVGEAMSYIQLYQQLRFSYLSEAERAGMWKEDKMKMMMDAIANDTVKAYFLKEQLQANGVNNLSEFQAVYEPYEKLAWPADVKKKYKSTYDSFIGDTAFIGKSAYHLTLPDTSGRLVSFKSFKGKVVLIDVWATWCGPCREQFPYLKEVEKMYEHNANIVFVGISTDKLKDKQKWLNTIRKENLPGVQLLDDFGQTFGRKYQITAIPRFLLIDKQGRWVEIRCPKPENKRELMRYIDKALK